MKKHTVLFLFFLCLFSNIILVSSKTAFSQNIMKQGVYTLADLNKSPDNLYEVENTSSKEKSYIAIFDEDDIILQSIRLSPNSISYNLVPMKPDYKIVVLGKGELYITPKKNK